MNTTSVMHIALGFLVGYLLSLKSPLLRPFEPWILSNLTLTKAIVIVVISATAPIIVFAAARRRYQYFAWSVLVFGIGSLVLSGFKLWFLMHLVGQP